MDIDTSSPTKRRVHLIPVRWTDEELALLDRERGQQTRSEFIRAAVVRVATAP